MLKMNDALNKTGVIIKKGCNVVVLVLMGLRFTGMGQTYYQSDSL